MVPAPDGRIPDGIRPDARARHVARYFRTTRQQRTWLPIIFRIGVGLLWVSLAVCTSGCGGGATRRDVPNMQRAKLLRSDVEKHHW